MNLNSLLPSKMRSFLLLMAFATFVALFVRAFVFENYRIASNSMVPNLLAGDVTLVSKSYFNIRIPFSNYELFRLSAPERGQVVAFTLPERSRETFVKRVIGLAGDRVEIKEGKLCVNEECALYPPIDPSQTTSLLSETFASSPSYLVSIEKDKLPNYGPIFVPKEHFFALGDNRDDSIDSRTWGPVPLSCLRGKISMILLSLDPSGSLRSHRLALQF